MGARLARTCQNAFADLDVDPDRVQENAGLIPGAMRGITSERQLGTYSDLDMPGEVSPMPSSRTSRRARGPRLDVEGPWIANRRRIRLPSSPHRRLIRKPSRHRR